MHLLDICDDALLEILSLVEPIDLVNIFNVCKRLRALTERIMNKGTLKLNLTGIDCFPILKHRPFDSLERIRVNRNWLDGKFSKTKFLIRIDYFSTKIVLDEHFYVPKNGVILKYNLLWNDKYLSSKFKVIGSKRDPKIRTFAKKDDVIFAGYINWTCMIFNDGKPVTKRAATLHGDILDLDLFPKNDIYVQASLGSVGVWNQSLTNGTLLPVANFYKSNRRVKIDPSGEKLAVVTREFVALYNFNTNHIEELVGLDESSDILWKDDQTVLTGHDDGSLRVFDLRTKSLCQQIDPLREDYNASIQFDGQNTVLCGFGRSRTVSICDLRMSKVITEFNIFNEEEQTNHLRQIVADQKHLFVVTFDKLNVCDFSII